jgi:NitT/TauT family transport system substrate-binding protein
MKSTMTFFAKTMLTVLTILGTLTTGPSFCAAAGPAVPTIRLGYIYTTHHMPLIAALERGKAFNSSGAYFKEVLPKQKYELYAGNRKLANIDLILNKSGSETATMFAMERLDVALASITAIMSGIDKGAEVKMLCPTHVDGMALVVPKDSAISTWDDFISRAHNSPRPIAIGYHSPTSAPKIILESALAHTDIKVTENPNDAAADVLLVDIKSTANFIPVLISHQVDGVVAPAPFPEVTELKGVGRIVTDLRDLPPAGAWYNFPCCVMAAREETLATSDEAVRMLVQLMAASASWSNDHKQQVAAIAEKWMGTPASAVEKSTIIYTVQPSQNWLRGAATYLDMLNRLHKLSGSLAGQKFRDVRQQLFKFDYLPQP